MNTLEDLISRGLGAQHRLFEDQLLNALAYLERFLIRTAAAGWDYIGSAAFTGHGEDEICDSLYVPALYVSVPTADACSNLRRRGYGLRFRY